MNYNELLKQKTNGYVPVTEVCEEQNQIFNDVNYDNYHDEIPEYSGTEDEDVVTEVIKECSSDLFEEVVEESMNSIFDASFDFAEEVGSEIVSEGGNLFVEVILSIFDGL